MTSAADDRLLSPYRPVRRVTAGDVPWSGLLVRLDSGESRVLVDSAELPGDWPGWTSPPDGHLLAPLDVVRRSDGHSVLMPLCVERVGDFLRRREAARAPLSLGEAVTLGVSLVRGFAAWDSLARGTGEWWLTDAGRPMLAVGSSGRDAGPHTADLLAQLAGLSSCADALAVAIAAVSGERASAYELRAAEEALFQAAVPEPLVTTQHAPRSARELSGFDRQTATMPDAHRDERGWIDGLVRHVDADLADVVSRATTGLWRRLRTSAREVAAAMASGGRHGRCRPRRRPAVADGCRWPGDSGHHRHRRRRGRRRTHGTRGLVLADRRGSGRQPRRPTDLAAVADALLTARTLCAGSASCLADVMVDPSADFGGGAIDLGTSQRETILLDDFGGMAVLRVTSVAADHDAQLVVIMLQNDRWLLRDVHVAKQP